jgi:hypothetical protein
MRLRLDPRFRRYLRFRYILAATFGVILLGGAVASWQVKASQEGELGLAARFLGVPGKAVQLVAAGQTGRVAQPSGAAQPTQAPGKGRSFAVLYTDPAAGSKPEKVALVANEGMDFITEAYWDDAMNARPAIGAKPIATADLQAKSQEFLQHHGPLPGAEVRLAQMRPMPVDVPQIYMSEWELFVGDGKWPQAKALVAVSAFSGRVVMYRYSPMDTSQFGKVCISQEKAVAVVTGLFPPLQPGTQVKLRRVWIGDRSGWTQMGRPVWQVAVTVTFPPGSHLPDEPLAFAVDAISGKVAHNELLERPNVLHGLVRDKPVE